MLKWRLIYRKSSINTDLRDHIHKRQLTLPFVYVYIGQSLPSSIAHPFGYSRGYLRRYRVGEGVQYGKDE